MMPLNNSDTDMSIYADWLVDTLNSDESDVLREEITNDPKACLENALEILSYVNKIGSYLHPGCIDEIGDGFPTNPGLWSPVGSRCPVATGVTYDIDRQFG